MPLPSKASMLAISGFAEGETGFANITLSITHAGKDLPFKGMPFSNILNVKMADDPPSAPPPSPPAPPPVPKTYACMTRAAEHPGFTTVKRDGALCGNTCALPLCLLQLHHRPAIVESRACQVGRLEHLRACASDRFVPFCAVSVCASPSLRSVLRLHGRYTSTSMKNACAANWKVCASLASLMST